MHKLSKEATPLVCSPPNGQPPLGGFSLQLDNPAPSYPLLHSQEVGVEDVVVVPDAQLMNNNEWKLAKHVERLPWVATFSMSWHPTLHNTSIINPFKNLVIVYLSLQNTPHIGQINASKSKRWESIPVCSRSLDQIELLMVKIVDSSL